MKKLLLILAMAIFLGGCWDSGNEQNSANENATNLAASNNNQTADSGGHLVTKTPEPVKVENNAETLTPVVNSYCAAVKSGDDAALRKTLSDATWATYTKNAAGDGFKSVAAWLEDGEPIGNKCRVINQRLQGNVGEANVSTETYPNGISLKFVNENGSWKMTKESSDFDKVRNQVK
ncbi:MAG: hypothetical protein ACK5NT_01060 [Pyrinomonadaceae bacterium]